MSAPVRSSRASLVLWIPTALAAATLCAAAVAAGTLIRAVRGLSIRTGIPLH